MLGQARRVIAKKENTTIVEWKGEKTAIDARVAQIRAMIAASTSDFDKNNLQERLAKLAGGVGVLKVGAATEVEQKNKKLKLEDALNATKAAVEEGIVPGGGVALLRAAGALDSLKLDGEELIGSNILRRAVEEPIRQIAQNAGIDGAVVAQKTREGAGDFGFNAAKMAYENLIAAGVVDPTKVVRTALENAVSAASMLLTTEAVISELPKKESGAPGGMPPMMGQEDY